MALLSVRNVYKSFGDVEVLRGIDLDIQTSEVLCLLGPSGSGKSTLLRCLNMLEWIDEGAIFLDGKLLGHEVHGDRKVRLPEYKVVRQRRNFGMVFQSFNLFPHMTAIENIMEGPSHLRLGSKAEIRQEAEELLGLVHLPDKGSAYPNELSGGQQQRVAIARAMATHPKMLLFDEPTSALDPELVGEVLEVMRDLADRGSTMIVVTHEMGFAREVADQVAVMDDGVIVEEGPARQVLDNASHSRTRAFVDAIQQRDTPTA